MHERDVSRSYTPCPDPWQDHLHLCQFLANVCVFDLPLHISSKRGPYAVSSSQTIRKFLLNSNLKLPCCSFITFCTIYQARGEQTVPLFFAAVFRTLDDLHHVLPFNPLFLGKAFSGRSTFFRRPCFLGFSSCLWLSFGGSPVPTPLPSALFPVLAEASPVWQAVGYNLSGKGSSFLQQHVFVDLFSVCC